MWSSFLIKHLRYCYNVLLSLQVLTIWEMYLATWVSVTKILLHCLAVTPWYAKTCGVLSWQIEHLVGMGICYCCIHSVIILENRCLWYWGNLLCREGAIRSVLDLRDPGPLIRLSLIIPTSSKSYSFLSKYVSACWWDYVFSMHKRSDKTLKTLLKICKFIYNVSRRSICKWFFRTHFEFNTSSKSYF